MVQIVVAGRDDVAAPPAFDPFIWIDLPACVIKYGINCHQHEHKERHSDMKRQDKREDREEPSGADRFYRVKGKTCPRRRLDAAVMAFMSPFKELAVVHDTVGEIKPRILDEEINQPRERYVEPAPNISRHRHIKRGAARFPNFDHERGGQGIDKGANGGELYLIANGLACRLAF